MNADKLKELMQNNGYTYRSLAQKIGVQHVTIWNWANGVTSVSGVDVYKKLCDALGCDMKELL